MPPPPFLIYSKRLQKWLVVQRARSSCKGPTSYSHHLPHTYLYPTPVPGERMPSMASMGTPDMHIVQIDKGNIHTHKITTSKNKFNVYVSFI